MEGGGVLSPNHVLNWSVQSGGDNDERIEREKRENEALRKHIQQLAAGSLPLSALTIHLGPNGRNKTNIASNKQWPNTSNTAQHTTTHNTQEFHSTSQQIKHCTIRTPRELYFSRLLVIFFCNVRAVLAPQEWTLLTKSLRLGTDRCGPSRPVPPSPSPAQVQFMESDLRLSRAETEELRSKIESLNVQLNFLHGIASEKEALVGPLKHLLCLCFPHTRTVDPVRNAAAAIGGK